MTSCVGNTVFQKHLKLKKGLFFINEDKVKEEARYDWKWVLRTTTNLVPEEVALKYKQLLDAEQVFREMKSIIETRPIFQQTDEAIRKHVFCSFWALLLKKELYRRIEKTGCLFEWHDIKQDLEAPQPITIGENLKNSPLGPNAPAFVEKFSMLSAWPSHQRSKSFDFLIHDEKEQNVVPRPSRAFACP